MPYDLLPANYALKPFQFGAFSFPVLLDACGYLFACVHNGPRWYCDFLADPRLKGEHPETGEPYPTLLGGGFDVTAEEAGIMARMARNFVAIQRGLPEENRGTGMRSKSTFHRADLVELLTDAMTGGVKPGPWPEKVRDDFTEKIAAFAEWAPRSCGFHIQFHLTVNGARFPNEE
jgi:hypothetical protein